MRDLPKHSVDRSLPMHVYRLWARAESTMFVVEAPCFPDAVTIFRCHEPIIKFEQSYTNVWYGRTIFLDPYNTRYRIPD